MLLGEKNQAKVNTKCENDMEYTIGGCLKRSKSKNVLRKYPPENF